jgi:sulfur-oxidizing protein SoxX
MKLLILTSAVVALTASSAFAEPVAPSDVKFVEGEVAMSLTGVAGDPVAGREVFKGRKLGNCLACHVNAEMPEESFHGEVAPPIDGAGSRWNEAQLRAIVTNSKMVFEDTIMPAFYRDAGYTRTLGDFEGKSILNAQQVEDVIAYLQTLKDE